MLSQNEILQFQQFIWQFYKENGRSFAWRNINNPYYIMVSEIMLQQTQTERVIAKYEQFITSFSTVRILAQAELRDVFAVWQGLGYNRRAKALWHNAQRIVQEYNGIIPNSTQILLTFEHIGPNTAASIAAFAYNIPTIFIETNIRTVYMHSFFQQQASVHDKEIIALVAQTVDYTNPREWYYALMDYGVYLKKIIKRPNQKSAHYKVQSKFNGSSRQIRGQIIAYVTKMGHTTRKELCTQLGTEHERYNKVLDELLHEKMLSMKNDVICI